MLEFLKPIFDGKALTQEQFEAALPTANVRLANLSDGGYVSKSKYDDDLRAKDTNIQTLTNTITERDTAMKELKKQLETAGTNAEELEKLKGKIGELETKAEIDKTNYEKGLKAVKVKSGIKDIANGLEFVSKAAKEHFINYMIAKDLELDGDKLIGATDCLESYKADYADSFKTEEKEEDTNPHSVNRTKKNPDAPKPTLTELMKRANQKKK